MVMPNMPYRFPNRDVAAEDNPRNAIMKDTAETRYKNEDRFAGTVRLLVYF
jgi:hypothetical protein